MNLGVKFYYQLLDAIAKEWIGFPSTLNARIPYIQTTSAEEYLRRHWVKGEKVE
jgi:hypothetical protein